MTIHAANSRTYAWKCDFCRACKCGYGSPRAAHDAEVKHNQQALHPAADATKCAELEPAR